MARRNAEARFERLSEAGVIGILVGDMTGRISEINDTVLRMIGYSRDEILSGEVFWGELTAPGSELVDARARAQLEATGIAELREKEYVRKDGSRVPVMVGSARIDDRDGRIISFVLDLTERRRVENAARTEQARFRALVEESADGIVLSTLDGTLSYVSPAAARMFGRSAESLVGTNFRRYVHPDDLETTDEQRQRVLLLQSTEPIARRLVRPDGSVRWLEVTATNRLDEPAIGAIVGNLRDVTERKQADDARVIAERRLRAFFESGIVGVIISEVSGPIHDANDTFLSMVGYTRQDLESGALDWKKLTPPEWKESLVELHAELLRTGHVRPREKEYLRKDGSRVPVLVGVAKVEGPFALALSIDLSDRKRAEAEKANLELHLRQAQKMEAIGRLAGGVAHDFNNVLSVILGYCDMLLESTRSGDPVKESVEEIRKAGHRAAALTHQLLAFSRQQIMERKVIDLSELVADMDKLLRPLLGEDIELVFKPSEAEGATLVDPSSIEQVILNLVVNARDAMPTGGTLTITTENVDVDERLAGELLNVKPGPFVMLTVTDTGTGMDRATQARIFEPFFTTKERGKGTGLGLATVFGVVARSGGAVWVDSDVGRGSTFKIYLPRVAAKVDTREPSERPPAPGGGETILLVEDDDQLRAVARGILARNGYDVVEARNGGEALRICAQHTGAIHLLLSDVVMPQMSGPELAERLVAARPTMKVLCMSGYTDDSVQRHGLLDSRFAFVQKPITRESLTRKVREILDARTR